MSIIIHIKLEFKFRKHFRSEIFEGLKNRSSFRLKYYLYVSELGAYASRQFNFIFNGLLFDTIEIPESKLPEKIIAEFIFPADIFLKSYQSYYFKVGINMSR